MREPIPCAKQNDTNNQTFKQTKIWNTALALELQGSESKNSSKN